MAYDLDEIDLDEIEDLHRKQDHFTLLHCNLCSIGKNLEGVSVYLSQYTFNYDIIAITET